MSRFKLHQIIRLREMLRKWRSSIHREARSNSSCSGSGEMSSVWTSRVPVGHLAVYVGQERKRFVIKTSLLAHPLFKALLRKAEEELGFHYEGGLTLPCDVSFFQYLLFLMQSKHVSQNPMLMMTMMHQGQGEVCVHDNHERKKHHGVLQLLCELLHFHVAERSALLVNRCGRSGPPPPPITSSLPQPVF